MTEPVTFPSTTPNTGLPLLFAGQAQKEFFVNQSLAILDALAPRAIAGSLNGPPANPDEGACYRVTGPGAGEWVGRTDQLALRIGGSWHWIIPAEGMAMFDRAAGQWLCYRSGWQAAPASAPPSGGNVVDSEARAALGQLIGSLQAIGLLGPEGT